MFLFVYFYSPVIFIPFYIQDIELAKSLKWTLELVVEELHLIIFEFVTNASQTLEDCLIHGLGMVSASSKQSLLLLWIEEVSQTLRGTQMECVFQITLQDARTQESDRVLPYQHQNPSPVHAFPWIQWRNCRVSTVTRQELWANHIFLPLLALPPPWLWKSGKPAF